MFNSYQLTKAKLVTMPSVTCLKWFWDGVTSESQYCAYDPKFKSDACRGDSGGPLQVFRAGSVLPSIVGVVSYGIANCPSEAPDVYAKVSYYLDWIQSKVWPDKTAMKYFSDKNFNNFDSGFYTVTIADNGRPIYRPYVERTFNWNFSL